MKLRFTAIAFYIATVLFVPATIPAQETGNPGKCITLPATSRNPKSEKPLFALPTELRDSLLSPSGRFLIHYDSTGNPDSVTDIAYVRRAAEEADSAYEFEVGELGYDPPAFTYG